MASPVVAVEEDHRPVDARDAAPLEAKPPWPVAANAAVPVAVAVRLANGAVRVLPAGCRCRYDAEFGSELYELAAAGASRWEQMMYAVRLLDRAWVLRAELRKAAVQRARS
jgi:hypothetical protein